MNVYDFDGTIYDGDSTVDFYRYCFRKHPGVAFCVFRQAWGLVRYATGRIDTTKFKEEFFCFLPRLSSLSKLVEEFWNVRKNKIKMWYFAQRQNDDVIISASPAFLLEPICKRLKIAPPIATEMDPATGKIEGINCKGEEKVKRFFEQYPDAEIQKFYSDSLTDTPLAVLAKEAFLVQGDVRLPWNTSH